MKSLFKLLIYLLWMIVLLQVYRCSNNLNASKVESVQKTAAAADELLAITQELRQEIDKKVENNPNSTTEDFIALVDQKTQEIEQIKAEVANLAPTRSATPIKQRDFNKIRSYQARLGNISREVGAIYKSFKKELDKQLKSDVYFDTGSSIISITGEEELKKIITTDIKSMIGEWQNEEVYKNQPMKVKFKVTGYADLQGSNNTETRKQKNLLISEKRAEAVKNCLLKYLNEINDQQLLKIEIASEGKGEEAPPGLINKELINNPDRRTCFISGYVIPDLK